MPQNHRAYSVLDIKSIDEAERTLHGIATTPSVDRMGDEVDSLSLRFASDLPLFLYHDSRSTIGRAFLSRPTATGVAFRATIPRVTEVGRLRDRVEEAWQMLKYRLLTGVSIGFRANADKTERTATGYRFRDAEVVELSLVPVPANAEATIQSIKSLLAATAPAASGRMGLGARVVRLDDRPGAAGLPLTTAPRGVVYLNPQRSEGSAP